MRLSSHKPMGLLSDNLLRSGFASRNDPVELQSALVSCRLKCIQRCDVASSTVRISESSRRALRDLAAGENAPLQTVLERAIENYRRNRFLDAVNATFEALKHDPDKWSAEQAERDEWSATAADDFTE